MVTHQEWFCLKEARKNFKPQVWNDRSLIFCHEEEMQKNILQSIQKRFSAGEPVKMMLFGDWGVGKTHAVNHIAWWLDQNAADYPARALIVELSDVTKKSRFDTLLWPFLDQLSLERLLHLAHNFQPVSGEHVSDGLKKRGVLPHVADAFSKLLLVRPGDTPPQHVMATFEYLKGGSPKNAADIGLGQTLDSSDDFYNVLLAVGILFEMSEKKKLIYVCDEAAKLEEVDRDDSSRQHWTAVNRMIFDDRNDVFGFIYTMSGKSDRHLAKSLADNQIKNRLGSSNLIELRNLEQNDVSTFLKKLLDSFVDHEKVAELIKANEIDEKEYVKEFYPFTQDAWEEFLSYWNQNGEDAKPRDICDKLNDIGFVAITRKSRLIDDQCLQDAGLL